MQATAHSTSPQAPAALSSSPTAVTVAAASVAPASPPATPPGKPQILLHTPAHPPAPVPSPAASLGGTLLALLVVVSLILGLAWLARRLPGLATARQGGLRVITSLPLSPRERLLVVQVGSTQLLLSSGMGGTRLLHTLEQPLPDPAPQPLPTPFAQVLARHFGRHP